MDTNMQECIICHYEADCIEGVCLVCSLKRQTESVESARKLRNAAPQLLAACEKGEDMLRKLISLVLASGIIAEVEEELPEHCGDEYGNNSTLDKMTKAIAAAEANQTTNKAENSQPEPTS